MTVTVDIYDVRRNLVAKKGTEITIVSDHIDTLIVKDEKGKIFSVHKSKINFS